MIKGRLRILLFLLLMIGVFGSCVRVKQYTYKDILEDYREFRVTARLDGTYHGDSLGNITNPYELVIFVYPRVTGKFLLKISLYGQKGKNLFEYGLS